MEFSFTTMGTASALPIANRYPSAHVLNVHERLFLIDCGEGAQMQLRRYNIPLSKIENIFISHLHGDHVFGLFGLLSTFGMLNRLAPLNIYGPDGLNDVLDFFKSKFGEGVKYKLNFIKIKCNSPLLIYENKSLEVYAFPLRHRGETYGYLFREKTPKLNVYKRLIEPYNLSLLEIAALKRGEDISRGDIIFKNSELAYMPYKARSFAYCSDTAPFKKLSAWIKNTDMLYHEATFGDELSVLATATFHSTASQAAQCALEAGVAKLIIGHYSSRYKDVSPILDQAKIIFPNTFSAKEGMKFELPLDKKSE